MKGGYYGLKISQFSLILIAFVCSTVLVLAWTKTTFLTSLIQPQKHFLQVSSDQKVNEKQILDGGNSSSQSATIADYVTKEKQNLRAPTDERQDIPPGVEEGTGSEEASEEKSSLKLKDNVVAPPNPIRTKSPGDSEWNGNGNVATPKERQEIPLSVEGLGSKEVSEEKSSLEKAEDGVLSTSTESTKSSGKDEWNGNVTIPKEKQVCNFAKGKWVMDPKRPLYSGFGCKRWLSSMWACRLTQRTDFEYEFLRWQPKDCKMDDFTGPKFLSRMVNKTLAFIGDSLGRQQFQSLMCMVSGGEESPDVLDVGVEYGLVKARGSIRPDGWAYRFPSTNTTILYYWSASLTDLTPINASNPTSDIAMHLDRPPAFLRRFIHKIDVLVLNTGHHWNRGKLNANRWIMYVGGVPNTNRKIADIAGAKNFTVHSIVNWVNSQLPQYPGLKAFYRSISPRHFFNGDWNTGGTCDNTTPLAGGKEVLKDESSDDVAAGATKGKQVKLLDITALSELRDEGHISRYSIKATPGMQDCLHWCLPGVPDTWNEILFAQL